MVKTPAEKWKDTIIKYRKQCQSILKISSSVRYAGVINLYGRTLTGIVNPKLKPLLKPDQVKNEFFILSTLMTLRKDSANSVGKLEHVILQHQKITVIILQKKDITYYVSIERKAKNLEKIISSIKKII
ncbi:MAG: hypothetical protein MAG458_00289 [Nitrosopumilus sp.]|nr:hypothetical protein [Nitrosopumilus sp.]